MPRHLNAFERVLARFAASNPGSWFYLNDANPIDRRLLPLTNGRVGLFLGQPVGLLETVGNPPPFANAVVPLRHTVTFEDGDSYAYNDNVQLRPRYAYYRFTQGTVAYGPMLREMPEAEIDALFAAAGLNPGEPVPGPIRWAGARRGAAGDRRG